ncbi:MAG TPA: hypothetical protein VF784_00675 [Anaerolineales bacterium]
MKRIGTAALLLAGVALASAAIFANQIGLDHNPHWGRSRLLLLLAGLLVLALAAFVQYRVPLAASMPAQGMAFLRNLQQRPVIHFLWRYRLAILAALSVVFALAVYTFFVSAGTWGYWPETTHYYDNLATAFRSGHLNLNIQPSTQLLGVADPYEPSLRNSTPGLRAYVDTVWDLAFYNRQFYLYWGPAPALLLVIVKLFHADVIGDQYLAFAFLAGLLVFSTLLILRLRAAFPDDVPAALVVIGVLATALGCPIPWMLNRAAIYEATIAGGQFFLIGGLYLAYTALEREPASYGRLLLAVVFWAIAAASRTLMLIPAAFLTIMVILWLATSGGRMWPVIPRLPRQLALAFPLVLGTAAVGWYNWARFGSVFETGLRYTLTFENLHRSYGETFSAYYALPSLWMFLFNLFNVQAKFPFLVATFGRSPAFLYLHSVDLYHAEDITGLLFCVPFALFAVVAIWNAARSLWQTYVRPHAGTGDHRSQLLLWISLSLAGSGLLTLAAIALYFNITMRFLAEFLPSLMPLAVLGVWQAYLPLQGKLRQRRAYVIFVIALGLLTIVVSLLLAFSESHGTVQHYNPHLMRQLIRLFGG